MHIKQSGLIVFTVVLTFVLISTSSITAFFWDTNISNIVYSDEDGGFTLFNPEDSFITYLINYNKEVVHTWQSTYLPGHSVYLLENGHLLRTGFLGAHPIFLAGGMGGIVQEFDWNGTIVWEFRYSSETYLSHHDIKRLPNGNILMIAWESKSYADAVAAGRNPNLVTLYGLWPDHVIEVQPTGPTSGEIVWEWHLWDHLIQDFDPSKNNYGVVEDHPELVDINFGKVTMDWNHINSIDYNEVLDQILLSVHNFNEIWVIDHSTTTQEAAGHTGGNSGKGGDLLYRWGNPKTYRAGTTSDQKLYGQHDARWIDPGCIGDGNILVFNNGLGRPGTPYSSIDEIAPPVDTNGSYHLEPGSSYGPEEQTWIYTADYPPDFYAYMISGSQRIENGNTVICDGKHGRFFEVTLEKETVWEYINPYPSPTLNNVFKIERYPSNYSGVANVIQRPENPERPSGQTNGKIGTEYNYSSSTTDPQHDQVYYFFDWGDNTNTGWIGPYTSGETVNVSHTWTKKGNFNIKVKAKDTSGHQSDWSDPLPVIMPKERIFIRPIEQFFQHHVVLYKLIQLLQSG
jgi:hypothetical protein